jgi:hypothetical protein
MSFPQRPLTPVEMPPVQPQVTLQNDQLAITAQNSTLRDVLIAVRSRTGAIIEGPLESANERVVVRLGPGPVNEVLSSLLQGSRFDYVILGSESNPDAVERLVLTMRSASPAGSASSMAQRPMQPAFQPQVEEDIDEGEPVVETMPEEQYVPPEAVPEAQTGGTGMGQPGMQMPPDIQQQPPGQMDSADSPQQQNPQQPQQPKTPEQLLRELQQMQQREQQTERNQPPPQ